MKFAATIAGLMTTAAMAEATAACPCAHVIVARASEEPAGTGMIGVLANATVAQIPGSRFEALDYPACLHPYMPSQTEGVATLTKLIKKYTQACPETKLVLMGYSQGAHVIADTLCGTSEKGFPSTKPADKSVTDKVAAVILMGDPSHLASKPYNVGTATNDGLFPRGNPAGCDAVQAKMMSFCDEKDMFCDSGDDIAVHMKYVVKYGEMAVAFAVSMLKSV